MSAIRFPNERRAAPAHRLYLLLFFLCGALLMRFSPEVKGAFPATKGLIPLLLLLPGLLSGCLSGSYLIPFGAMLLGAYTMERVALLGLPGQADFWLWLRALAPLLALLPVFFLLAHAGMLQSDACMAAYAKAGAEKRRLLVHRQMLVFAAMAAAGLAARFMI